MHSTPVPPNISGGFFPDQQSQPKIAPDTMTQADPADSKHFTKSSSSEQSGMSLPNDIQSDQIQGLTKAEQAKLQKMQQRDREVRAHEQAHIVAGGPYVQGGPDYELRMGPDGQLYAVAGTVNMDTSEVPDDPEATLKKAQTVRRAALAPVRPSAKDMQVAAQAASMIMQAMQELAQEKNQAEQQEQQTKDNAEAEEGKAIKSRVATAYQNQAEHLSTKANQTGHISSLS